jgi:hypothetical protein
MGSKYVKKEPTTIQSWLSHHGVIGLVIAIGVAMTGAIDFYVGIVLVVAGAVWAISDFRKAFHSEPIKDTFGIIAIALLCIAFVYHSYVFAPINVSILVTPDNYAAGENVLGIEWKENYFPITIVLENPTDVDYDDFDARFVPGGPRFGDKDPKSVLIAKANAIGGINNCIIGPDNPFIHSYMIGPEGFGHPLFGPDRDVKSNIIRLRCDKISSHSRIEVLIALDERVRPDWLVGDIQYKSSNISRSSYPTQCFIAKCDRLDATARYFVGDFR